MKTVSLSLHPDDHEYLNKRSRDLYPRVRSLSHAIQMLIEMDILLRHYTELVSEDEAKAFWDLKPAGKTAPA
jgi:hypothetical protein